MHKAHDLPVNTASRIKKDGRQPKRHAIVKTHFSGLTRVAHSRRRRYTAESHQAACTLTGIMEPGIAITQKLN